VQHCARAVICIAHKCSGTAVFAAGWSARFESAIGLATRTRRIALTEVIINAEFDLHPAERDNCFLSARLNVGLPGVESHMAEQLIEDA
jgi:osmotically inducible protein OsmC